MRLFFSDRVKEFVVYFRLYESSLPSSRREDQILLIGGKFSFSYVDIYSDVPKCNLFFEKQQFKMLGVLSPIFMADIKIIYGYNFLAPLIYFQFYFSDEIWGVEILNSLLFPVHKLDWKWQSTQPENMWDIVLEKVKGRDRTANRMSN